ncbi:MAG: hypothetical protein E8D47_13200 [Nitrospira sp.]|nr:MAG: hypothetical protein E8D47_13200 [Nitrospira sp.]
MRQAAIRKIIASTKAIERFWRQAHGWAPADAADLLAAARLDRQVSFTHTLSDYLKLFPPEQVEARQILGYTTLRSLCEGVLRLFFAVYLEDYCRDAESVRDKEGILVSPEDISFDRLIALYSKKVDSQYDTFLRRVQQRGNCIHHFKNRDIGIQDELIADIIQFRDFLLVVNSRLPYPDDFYDPDRA